MMTDLNHPSRRAFLARGLKTTLGICALAALKPAGSQGADSSAKHKANLRFGFTTYQWGLDWDIPTLIANLQKAQVFGAELRTSQSYAHGVEIELTAQQRRDVKKRFADSPITLVGIASGERMDWPEPEKLKTAIENAKGCVKLSRDVGASGVRVFPNQFHANVPREETIEQIAKALDQVGAFAADYGQEIRLEAHGQAGDLPTIRAIMDRVTQRSVRVKLNSDARDAADFEQRFNLVKDFLGHTVHIHNLKDAKFPYQLQTDLLKKIGWDGWALLEVSDKVPDRVQGLIEQRKIWENMVANSPAERSN
ncbi:MAG: TIM barrel protein [Verrucomicrobia bacterium]|nr:TIM barrel protein [Verrucomicrobiota bacterium]